MADPLKQAPTERIEEVRIRKAGSIDRRESFAEDIASERVQRFIWARELVWLLIGVIEAFLGFRILLKLVAANPYNAFARFIYHVSDWFAGAFSGLVKSPSAEGMVLEIPIFVAVVVYILIGALCDRAIWLFLIKPSAKTVRKFEKDKG